MTTKKKRDTYNVLALSDLHPGPPTSILPPISASPTLQREKRRRDGKTHIQEEFQREAYKRWRQMIQRVESINRAHGMRKVDALFLVGDLADGTNDRGKGDDVGIMDRKVQVGVAADLIRQIEFDRAFAVVGTDYHTGHNPGLDRMVADEVGAEWEVDMDVTVGGVVFNLAHASGTSSVAPIPPGLQREAKDTRATAKDFGAVDVIIRAHEHHPKMFWEGGQYVFVLPGWKTRDGYVQKKPFRRRFYPQLGGLHIIIKGGVVAEWEFILFPVSRKHVIKRYVVK